MAPLPFQEVLVFELDEHRFGVPAADVQEIVRAVAVAPLPRAPAFVEGVINLRGRAVPVLDLRRRFGLPSRQPVTTDHLVIARAAGRAVALRVDRAIELRLLDGQDAQAARDVVPGAEAGGWVAALPEGLLLVHDLGGLLSSPEAGALDAALTSVPREGR
jgi:purine-binding chemotaxis protein CheW